VKFPVLICCLALFLGACSPFATPGQEADAPLPSPSRAPAEPASGSPTVPAGGPGAPAASLPPATPTGVPTASANLLPDSTPASTLALTPLPCWSEGGRIETGSLPIDLLPDPLEFRVYLPPCYAAQPDRRYPSLYLIHGQSYTDDQWDRLGADESADALIAAGEMPPFLMIMPRDRRWDQPDQDHFGQSVADSLVPWIDAHYRTRPEREYRAVGGLSRGAGWAVHLALSRWELFGALGGHSTPVFWTDTYHIKEWLSAIPPEQMPRIYLDNPNNDRSEIMKSSIWFEKLLTQWDIAHEWALFTGYHEEKYWQAHVEQYLRWYAEGW
jgi:enterochelin esterase-like enzyme